MNAIDAAQALVDRAVSRFTGIAPEAVDAAAAAIVEQARPNTIAPAVQRLLGRAEAMSFATGAALANANGRELVEQAFTELDEQPRAFAANALGLLLARIDVTWAWSLVESSVRSSGSGALIAMAAVAAGLEPSLPRQQATKVPALNLLYGAIRDRATAPEVIAQCKAASWLSQSFDAQVFILAACALVDPVAALETLGSHDLWLKHGDVLLVVARELHARGETAAWSKTLPPSDRFWARAAWLSAGIDVGLVTGETGHALVAETFDAVYRNAAADEVATDCYPLLSAFVHLGLPSELVEAADRSRMPPGMLADLLFWNGKADVADDVITGGGFERLCARPPDEWSGTRSWGPSWWHDAMDSRTTLETSQQVASLAGHTPWQFPPNSLETFIDLLRSIATRHP